MPFGAQKEERCRYPRFSQDEAQPHQAERAHSTATPGRVQKRRNQERQEDGKSACRYRERTPTQKRDESPGN